MITEAIKELLKAVALLLRERADELVTAQMEGPFGAALGAVGEENNERAMKSSSESIQNLDELSEKLDEIAGKYTSDTEDILGPVQLFHDRAELLISQVKGLLDPLNLAVQAAVSLSENETRQLLQAYLRSLASYAETGEEVLLDAAGRSLTSIAEDAMSEGVMQIMHVASNLHFLAQIVYGVDSDEEDAQSTKRI